MATSAWAVNARIGDYSALHQKKAIHPLNENERITTHLLFVCDYLQSVSTAHLTTHQKINRRLVINALRCYARAGVFPQHNQPINHLRQPRFIDHRGVHCAVGELIKYTDGSQLPEHINQLHEYDYIEDIEVIEVAIWAEENGLTLDECALIQPSYIDYDQIIKELCPWVALSKGTDLEARTEALRAFRDQRLQQSASGRLLVRAYYKAGPRMVRFFADHPWSQEPARKTLRVVTRKLK